MVFWEVQIVESLKTNMASNKHKGSLSLQQVLDSNLNDDPENDLSEEESSEEEFDYDDIVTEDGQSLQFSDINIAPTFAPDLTFLPCCYDHISCYYSNKPW